ncbi:hypothetical protein BLNAU_15666 [Blattamonas nauphoetae]|uniref:Uncharacterized protein n=1 Tax=Blattamonas nauphoetae TaxID=2049346 RepID=A0ABQ9XDE4_9EUKA|nr:hypothetical protein BLNAU_15666 [Blattamonas nauphoetae]
MLTGPTPSDTFSPSQESLQDVTIDSMLDDLSKCMTNPEEFVNTPKWNQIPLLIREWKEGKDEEKMFQLLTSLSTVLSEIVLSDTPLSNKRLLHSSLSSLKALPTLPKNIRLRVGHCLASLESVLDGPFVLLETDEFRSMEMTLADLARANEESSTRLRQLEETSRIAEERIQKNETELSAQAETVKEASEMSTQVKDEVILLRKSLVDLEHRQVERRETEQKEKEARFVTISGMEMTLSFEMRTFARNGKTITKLSPDGWASFLSFEIGPVLARFSLVIGTFPTTHGFFEFVGRSRMGYVPREPSDVPEQATDEQRKSLSHKVARTEDGVGGRWKRRKKDFENVAEWSDTTNLLFQHSCPVPICCLNEQPE